MDEFQDIIDQLHRETDLERREKAITAKEKAVAEAAVKKQEAAKESAETSLKNLRSVMGLQDSQDNKQAETGSQDNLRRAFGLK